MDDMKYVELDHTVKLNFKNCIIQTYVTKQFAEFSPCRMARSTSFK